MTFKAQFFAKLNPDCNAKVFKFGFDFVTKAQIFTYLIFLFQYSNQ